jgi:hypothetical protein
MRTVINVQVQEYSLSSVCHWLKFKSRLLPNLNFSQLQVNERKRERSVINIDMLLTDKCMNIRCRLLAEIKIWQHFDWTKFMEAKNEKNHRKTEICICCFSVSLIFFSGNSLSQYPSCGLQEIFCNTFGDT